MSAREGFERAARPGRRRFGCSHEFVRGLLIVLTVAVSTACELFRPVDLDPDVVVLSLLLESEQTEARMLAIHPHRGWRGAAPEITATLEGPGWTAAFVDTGVREECDGWGGWNDGPFTCLRASLPEPIAPGTYGLRGRMSRGSFTGETTVPGMPLLMEPSDTLRPPVPDTSALILIPLHYQVDSTTSALLVDGELVVEGQIIEFERRFWELAYADTIDVFYDGDSITLDLQFRGIGPNYSNWFRHTDGELVLPPWPSYGIEGEGVYGYFDGISAPTRWIHIVVGEP